MDRNWAEQLEIYNLEDEIESLKKENKNLKKENRHFKSTKAYATWQKSIKFKGKVSGKGKAKPKTKHLKDIKVAIIADEFTYNCYRHEFTPLPVTPKNWKRIFEEEKPDLFFCESAWRGYNGKDKDPWRYKVPEVYTRKDPTNRKELFEILDYCKQHNIPTMFWNKEDPFHYKNEKISYAETAKHFDYIFTTSDKCVEQYKKDYNHPHVYNLMFAGQPSLFNPLNLTGETEERVVFAGSYYPNHPERSALMEVIFDRIIDQWDGKLKIFDRIYYEAWADYPDRFKPYTLPPIPYEQTAVEYRKANWGLNFNTITDSETMFARRVFELALSYTFVITNYSVGVEKIFGDNVFFFDKMDELPDFNYENDEMKLDNLYNVLQNHTYTIRWKQILDTIGIKYRQDSANVACVFYVDSANDIEDAIEKFKAINYQKKYLKLVINDDHFTNDDLDYTCRQHEEIDRIYFKTNDIDRTIAKHTGADYLIYVKEDMDPDFITHALLHYQYINKRIAIAMSDDKFRLGVENTLDNKLVPKKAYKEFFDGNKEIDVYYI
jgi:hypothetical protein